MNQELLTLFAVASGLILTALSILDQLLKFHDRFRETKQDAKPKTASKERAPQKERPDESAARSSRKAGLKLVFWLKPPLSYLLFREVLIIAGAGILLNYLGLVLSLQFESILYLDMTGTALAALLLGPWWGAIVALLSSCGVNWLLYPGDQADVVIFPWGVVNMTGGLLWGFLAKRERFRKYLESAHKASASHVWFLVTFGVLGAWVVAVPGTLLQAVLDQPSTLALNPSVVETVAGVTAAWSLFLQDQLGMLGLEGSGVVGGGLLTWMQNGLRYMPDKTVSVAIALVILKYGFPLFERELILGGPARIPPQDSRLSPLILGLVYAPAFGHFLANETYRPSEFWLFWAAPWLAVAGGYLMIRMNGPEDDGVREACLERADRYDQAFKPIRRDPAYVFCRRLTFATLLASTGFVLALPLLMSEFYAAALHFLCVVYGFLIAMHLVHVAIAQNVSVVHAED